MYFSGNYQKNVVLTPRDAKGCPAFATEMAWHWVCLWQSGTHHSKLCTARVCFVCDPVSTWLYALGLSYWLSWDVTGPVLGSSVCAIPFNPSGAQWGKQYPYLSDQDTDALSRCLTYKFTQL